MDGILPNYFKSLKIDWSLLGYLDDQNRQKANLTCPINEMFDKVSSSGRGFTGTNAEYSMMEPGIRLASALLSTPASQRFIYSMIHECKRLPSEFDVEGEPCYQFRQTTETNWTKIEHETRRIWHETSLCTEFGVMTSEQQDKQQDAAGYTSSYDVRKPGMSKKKASLDDTKIYDRVTRILIRPGYLDSIGALVWSPHDQRLLSLHFEVAVTLCHEVMHAIYFAAEWYGWLPGPHEPYYEDQFLPELGLAWEVEVFGGRIGAGLPPREEAYIPTTRDWPTWSDSREGIALWKRIGSGVHPDEDYEDPERTTLAPCRCSSSFGQEHFIISMVYIRTIQQQSFWDSYTGWSLHIPRTIGVDPASTNAPMGPIDMTTPLTLREVMDIFLDWLSAREDPDPMVVFYRKPLPRTLCDTAFSEQQLSLERANTETDLLNQLPRNLLELDYMLCAYWRLKKKTQADTPCPKRDTSDLVQLEIVLRKYLPTMSE